MKKVHVISGVDNAIVKITWHYTGLNGITPSSTCYLVDMPEVYPSFTVTRWNTYELWLKCHDNIACLRAKKEFINHHKGLDPVTIVSIEVM